MAQPDIADLLDQLAAADPGQHAQLVSDFLTANPDADLSAVEDAALDVSNNVYGDGKKDYSDSDLAQLQAARALFDHTATVRAEREQAQAERAGKAGDLRISPPDRDAQPEATEATENGTTQAAGAGDAGEAAPVPADTSKALEPVAASTAAVARQTPQSSGSDFARLTAGAEGGSKRVWSITAGADINGIPAGKILPDFDALTDAVTRRLEPMRRLGPNIKHTAPIATISVERDASLVADASSDQGIRRLVDHAANERRLTGGSLTAAGVWCAPSETVYDLCPDLATTEGMVNLPSITVSRGGIRYPQSPDYAEVYAQMQAGVWEWDPESDTNDPKPCTTIPCPDFDECRLTPYGLCIQTDILTQHAWPELVNDWTQRLLTAQQHLVNSRIISKMMAASTPVSFDGAGSGAAWQPGGTSSVLDVMELQATYLRTKFRMSPTATIEAVLPTWVRPFLRADLAKRTGVDLVSVPDARLDSYFRDRYISVQYVYDFEDIPADAAPSNYPWHVAILMYPAGTFVLADQAVIELSGIYDSTLLANNKFTGLFAESAECVIKRCYEALYITVDTCPDGATSAPVEYTCPVV